MRKNPRMWASVAVLTLLVACNLLVASAQSIADAARKERDRQNTITTERAATEKAAAEKAAAARAAADKTLRPAVRPRNTAGFQDCGVDMNCFVRALNAKGPAFVRDKIRLMDVEDVSYYMEVAGFKADAVSYYLRIDDARIQYAEAEIQRQVKSGKSRRDVEDTQRLMNDSLTGTIGLDSTCVYKTANLNAGLKDWLKRDYSIFSGLQLMGLADSCSGPLSEASGLKNATTTFDKSLSTTTSTPPKPAASIPDPAPRRLKNGESFRTKLTRASNWWVYSDAQVKVSYNVFLDGKMVARGTSTGGGGATLSSEADEVEVRVEGGDTTIRLVRK